MVGAFCISNFFRRISADSMIDIGGNEDIIIVLSCLR